MSKWVTVTTGDGHELKNFVTTGMRRTPRGMPSSLRICGDRWEVAYCTDLYQLRRKGKRLVKHKLYGCCVLSERLIVIETDCPRYEMLDTLYHEAGHAYCRKYLPAKSPLLKYEETMVEVFARAMSDLTANNQMPTETC